MFLIRAMDAGVSLFWLARSMPKSSHIILALSLSSPGAGSDNPCTRPWYLSLKYSATKNGSSLNSGFCETQYESGVPSRVHAVDIQKWDES